MVAAIRLLTVLALFAVTALTATMATPRPAQAGNSAEDLVHSAETTLSGFMSDPELATFQRMVREARAILIVPSLVKGGFFFGAEGGSAVLLARNEQGWSNPAFFTTITGSFGLQIGVSVSEVVLVIRTNGGLDALLKNNLRLGVEASLAVGPLGRGVDASTTTNLNADIIAFTKTQGLFGGGALEGGMITTNAERNELFYGQPLSAAQIVLDGQGHNPKASGLRAILH